MEGSLGAFKNWWRKDTYRWALPFAAFLISGFFVQGIRYWDSDYDLEFESGRGHSLLQLVWDWISPIYKGVDNWGFLDRPAQSVVYKICFEIAGYHAWPYLLFRSACFAGVAAMIYAWALRVLPESPKSRTPAAVAVLFFLVAPGPVGSLVWLADFGVAAEFAFLVLTFLAWKLIEETPADWRMLRPIANPKHRRWLFKWVALSFATYLGYKTKADLKLIPVIIGGYVLLTRRKQWMLFGIPLTLMLLLAVPWSQGVLTKLPPFIPGSRPAAGNYNWQPANFAVWREFLWSSEPYSFVGSWKGGTLSLAGLLGPFLLSAIVIYLLWKFISSPAISLKFAETSQQRARLFVILWFGAMLVGVSALPAINYFFRIRWGLLTLIPVTILLAWFFDLCREPLSKLPRWAAVGCIAFVSVQPCINLSRSIVHRHQLVQITNAIDQIYAYVDRNYPTDAIALAPNFRPYAYRPDASPSFSHLDSLRTLQDLPMRHIPNRTSVISWEPSFWEQLDDVQQFSGCNGGVLFEYIFPCQPERNAFLMRYIGPDPTDQAAEFARAQGDVANARRLYQQFLARHPFNMGARFRDGLLAYQQKDWAAADTAFATVEEYFPANSDVLYNRALTLIELKQPVPAIARLKKVVNMTPRDFGALANLYRAYQMDGNQKEASATLQAFLKFSPAGNLDTPPLELRDSQLSQFSTPIDDLAAAEQRAASSPTPENYLNLSLLLNRNHKYQESIAACRMALKLKPDFAEAYNNIAASDEALDLWDDAIAAAREALRLKPGFQLAQNNLNWSISQKAQQVRGLAAAEQRAKSSPTPENYLNLSLQLNRSHKYQDSIAACRAALKLRPDYAEAYNNISASYEAMQMWDQAIDAAEHALKIKPDYALARNNLMYSMSQKQLQNH